jgi:hypothetical protein
LASSIQTVIVTVATVFLVHSQHAHLYKKPRLRLAQPRSGNSAP